MTITSDVWDWLAKSPYGGNDDEGRQVHLTVETGDDGKLFYAICVWDGGKLLGYSGDSPASVEASASNRWSK